MDCFGNGVCMTGNRCFCLFGFSGDDCSISSKRAQRIEDAFVLSANFGGRNALDYSETISDRVLRSYFRLHVFRWGILGGLFWSLN